MIDKIEHPHILGELLNWAEEHSDKKFKEKVIWVYTKCLIKGKDLLANRIFEKYNSIILNSRMDDRIESFRQMLLAQAADLEYHLKREVPTRGLCGIMRQVFTVGLFYGIDNQENYIGRYCFHSYTEAAQALAAWDGIEDPPGNWIVHKGGKGEYRNPNYSKNE